MITIVSRNKLTFLIVAIGLFLFGASTGVKADVIAYYYANSSGSRYGAFGTIDLDTGAITVIKSNTVLGDAVGFGVVGGNLYTASRGDTKLYSIDPTNGNTTLKGSLGSGNGYVALGSTSDGLFAYLYGSKFATINPSDGSAVVKPTPPYTGVGGGMFPVWSTSTDSATLSECNSGTSEYGRYFGTINTSTGLGTLKNAALGTNIHLDAGGVRAMFEQGGTLYAIVQIGNQVMQGSTVGNLQAYTIDANGNATRYGTWAISSPDWNVQALAPVASVMADDRPLYFPHVDTSLPWQTEIAIINTSDQNITGTLRALSDEGQLIETKAVTLAPRGRRQITVANEFTNHTDIGYIVFDTTSDAVQGYTKFYQAGIYRAAIPVVKEVNTSDIYISHIDSSAQWWTGVSLVNTTSARKDLTITFNNGQSVPYTLNANEHKVFTIGSLLNQELQPDIKSAVITNASGVIGLELFGSKGGATQMDGLLLTDKTTSTIYYPHVDNNGWWTGIVAYNPSGSACTITITPYSAQGTPLSTSTLSIVGKGKYIGTVTDLGLPAQTAWFRIDSTLPLSGFELFGTADGNQLAAYAGGGRSGAKSGVFAKIEKNGWTGIAFVNTEDSAASVTLTAYNDNGTAVATQVLPVGGHAKVVNNPEAIFSQNISGATYIAYSSDKNVVGFQLNGSSDGMGMMLDGLPGL
jgi:hypothetical protein